MLRAPFRSFRSELGIHHVEDSDPCDCYCRCSVRVPRPRTPILLLRSVERLHLHESVIVVAADPERHRRRRIIDEHRTHIGVGWHQILHRLARLGIEPHDPVRVHRGGPQFTVLVEISPVRELV